MKFLDIAKRKFIEQQNLDDMQVSLSRKKNVYDLHGEVIENLRNYKKDGEEVIYALDYDKANYVLRYDEQSEVVELVYYKEEFLVPKQTEVGDDEILQSLQVSRNFDNLLSTRKFKLNLDGNAIPIDSTVTIADLQKNVFSGNRRAIHTFYDYALSNTWEYFATLTFANEEIRNNVQLLGYYWRSFIKELQKANKDVRALAVYEEFKTGKGYHLHALIGNVDLLLLPARNNDKDSDNYLNFMYSRASEAQIFNCKNWKNGYSTVCTISPDSNQAQVVNYLSKYMTKSSPAPYGYKRYFHTQNLKCRNTLVGNIKNIYDVINKFKLKKVKEKGNYVVYRNYGDKFID